MYSPSWHHLRRGVHVVCSLAQLQAFHEIGILHQPLQHVHGNEQNDPLFQSQRMSAECRSHVACYLPVTYTDSSRTVLQLMGLCSTLNRYCCMPSSRDLYFLPLFSPHLSHFWTPALPKSDHKTACSTSSDGNCLDGQWAVQTGAIQHLVLMCAE